MAMKQEGNRHPQMGGNNGHHDRLCALECLVAEQGKQIKSLIKQGAKLMASMKDLETEIAKLEASEQAREQRDLAQDAVTAQQITALNAAVAALQAIIDAGGGGLSAADQAILDASVTKIEAVVTSLDAADPTPPVV
jgi:uncharacterized coiled-coil protein SlyX